MKEEYWIGNDGKPIAVGDMTEEHMRNALRKLIREGRIVSKNTQQVKRKNKDGEYDKTGRRMW